MIRACIIGKYNDTDVLSVTRNCRQGHDAAIRLAKLGFAVHDPWLDLHWALVADLPMEFFKANCMAWLEVSNVVLALPSWYRSGGAKAEIDRARELDIPVFYSENDLIAWAIAHE
jgi:hypothetical protein